MSSPYEIASSILLLFIFGFIIYVFVLSEQKPKLNWAIFYSFLYTLVSLPIVNYLCVHLGLWKFEASINNAINFPFDLYFYWLILWSVVPVYFLKGRGLLIVAIILFWLDILIMPILEKNNIVSLSENWYWGEILLIFTVFAPAYFWAYCSYFQKYIGLRAIFQILCMIAIFIIGIPFIMQNYDLIDHVQLYFAPFLFQLLFIISLPALIAVQDLVKKGKGTPFPYDPTQKLVRTGVYAYIKNPIQWSFTLIFIPIGLYYESYYFLLGSLVSIAYSYGIANFQEYSDMEKRFGKEWTEYKQRVPNWRFLWKPLFIPKGKIYFDDDCNQCLQIKKWFISLNAQSLQILSKAEFPKEQILQVTYIDHDGLEYKGIRAIACALEHINLAYASLAWLMRLPIITQLLQVIVDSMGIGNTRKECELN